MILIITNSTDVTTQEVCRWLDSQNKKCFLLKNQQDLLIAYKRLIKNKYYFKTIWFRKYPDFNNFDTEEFDLKEFYKKELDSILYFIQSSSKVFKLSSIQTTNLNKIKVLESAKQLKLNIPDYIITDKKEELKSFFIKHDKQIISKSIFNITDFECNSKIWLPYTIKVEEDFIEEINSDFFPSFFQKQIDKSYELRIFYLLGKFYSAAIMSQDSQQTKIDFRMYDNNKPNRVLPYSLPSELEIKLDKLMKIHNLNTGSIDLLFTDWNEKYYFLEINPNGQFGMISKPCNYNLEKKVADLLIEKSNV